MISPKALLLLLLPSLALSAPADLEAQQGARWICNNGREFTIKQSDAERVSHIAPLSDGKTATSYPHWFTNGYDPNVQGVGKLRSGAKGPSMKFGNGLCDRVPTHTKNGNGKDDNYLLEFPVFPDGHAYNFNKKPKDDPGAARVIYTYPQKVFCGVVSHTNGNQGDLRLCRRV